MVTAKQRREGGIATVVAGTGIFVNWLFPGLAKDLFFGAVGDALKAMLPNSVTQPIAEYLPYFPWAILLTAGIMGITGWGADVTVHITRPFFRCGSKPKDTPSPERQSDFQIEIDTNTTKLGDPFPPRLLYSGCKIKLS